MLESLKRHFPFQEIREGQSKALEKIAIDEERGKKFSILELPVGVGKSGCAISVLGWAAEGPPDSKFKPGGTILTIQKILQDQYTNEFKEWGLADIRGAASYTCEDSESNCEVGQMINGLKCPHCPYVLAKNKFRTSPYGLTNFSYFLTDSMFHRQFPDKKAIVIDEAHNTEDALISFCEIVISQFKIREFQVSLPSPPVRTIPEAKAWVRKELLDKAEAHLSMLKISGSKSDLNVVEASRIAKKITSLSSFIENLTNFLNSESNLWFVDQDDKKAELVIKPLVGSMFADKLLFSRAEKIILMSGTILDAKTFVNNLGIPTKECGYLSLPSDFPVENRRVVITPAGSMSYRNYEQTFPKLVDKIARILAKHKEEKGIIHCQSFKLMNMIMEALKGTPEGYRLLTHDSKSRTRVVGTHIASDTPTVLLSPSMTEGLDLRDELSRFQIVAKMPFLPLTDNFVKEKMKLDPGWYPLQTALTLIQGLGRSVRSKEDYARSYILDSDFNTFYSHNGNLLPEWWRSSLIWK